MGRRRRAGLVLVIVAIGLTLAVVRIVRRDLLRSTKASPSASLEARASRDLEAARPDGGDSSTSELEAERVREPPLPPPREGMVRYHARFVRTDKKPHSGFIVAARPSGSAETQTFQPTKEGDVLVDASADCSSIDFTSRGFVTVHKKIRQSEIEREELGSIVFEQAATLQLEIVHAPRHATKWLHVAAAAKVEAPIEWGDSINFGMTEVATPDGSARTTFYVPSETELRIDLNGEGVCSRRVIPSLPAGASVYTLDFTQLRSLRGRIVGIPATCAQGVEVRLGRYWPELDGIFPNTDASVPLDEQGRFLFPGVPDEPFRLELMATGLRAADETHRDWWRTDELLPERELELEPVEPLLGVEVGPLDVRDRGKTSQSLGFDGPSPASTYLHRPGNSETARGLIRAAWLQNASRVTISVTHDGSEGDVHQIVVAKDGLPPPKNQVLSIRVDQLRLPSASLTVSLPWLASRDWTFFLEPSGEQPYSRYAPISVRRERGFASCTFTELNTGSYDLFATLRNGWFHRVATQIVLGDGESASLDLTLPERSRVGGRITNWDEIPAALRPSEISIESSSRIVNGRFVLEEVLPITGKARFVRHEEVIGVEVDVETREDDSLAVVFPVNDLDLFELHASVPEEGNITAIVASPTCPETVGIFDQFHRVSADANGVISIVHRREESVRGWITEYVPHRDSRILSWFTSDLPTNPVVPSGRFVEITNDAEGTTATVLLVPRNLGTWQPPRIPIYKVITGMPRRFWLPAGVEFVDVEFAGRPRDRVPAASIGERWTIAPK